MSRLTLMATSRRRSPSTVNRATASRIRATSGSLRSFTFVEGSMPALAQTSCARVRPMPCTCVKATQMCLLTGMLIPAIRAIFSYPFRVLTLTLLVPRVGANDPDDPIAPNDLAVTADLSDRCSDFHSYTPATAQARPLAPLRFAFFIKPSYW